MVIFLFLISGFWRLQVQNPEFYDERAQQNSIKSVPIPGAARAHSGPRRPRDRRQSLLVQPDSGARIRSRKSTCGRSPRGWTWITTTWWRACSGFATQPKYVTVVIKEELSPADLAFVDSHHDFFPELVLIQSQRRLYPQNGMMAHVIGYTGEISEQELDSPEFAKYNQGDVVGQVRHRAAVQRLADGRGRTAAGGGGQSRAGAADARHKKAGGPGKDLQLTIDLDLQAVAELAMDGKNGAVVALDPRTGEVLAMVSRPTFDPEQVRRAHQDEGLEGDRRQSRQAADEPGDSGAVGAGLHLQAVRRAGGLWNREPSTSSSRCTAPAACRSTARISAAGCRSGHGTLSLHNGIVHSCDVYFYTIGSKAGIDNLAFYGDMAGFGQATGIDLPHEKSGIMPSTEWKLRTQRTKWYAGETIPVRARLRIARLAAASAPAARGMAGPEVGPLAQIGLAENHRSRLAQSLGDEGIARRDGAGESERAGGGHHAIGGIDVVLDENGNAVQRAARPFVAPLFVERIGDRQRVGIELDDGVDGRPALVDFVDALEILLRQGARASYLPDFIRCLQIRDGGFIELEGFYGHGCGESIAGGQARLRRQAGWPARMFYDA